MQDKRILVLLEDFTIRREVIQYAVALAQRIDARLTLLMLLPNVRATGPGAASAGTGDVARGEAVLGRTAEGVAGNGVEIGCEVIRGEPHSEFLKFVATRPSFHTVVWGGDPGALRRGTGHWISAVGLELSCPLVTPTRKRPAGRKSPRQR